MNSKVMYAVWIPSKGWIAEKKKTTSFSKDIYKAALFKYSSIAKKKARLSGFKECEVRVVFVGD